MTGDFAPHAHSLLASVEDLLDDPNPRSRVAAVHHLSVGVKLLEQQVIADARARHMSWAAIGEIYGLTRQGAQQRFS